MKEDNEAFLDEFFSKLGKDGINYTLAKVVPTLASLAMLMIFTRIFDPSNYGIYTLIKTASFIAMTLLAGWLQQALLRYTSQYSEKSDKIKSLLAFTSEALYVVLLLAIIVFAIASYFGIFQTTYLLAVCAGVSLTLVGVPFRILKSYFQATLSANKVRRYDILNSVLKLALSLALVLLFFNHPTGIVFGMGLAYLIGSLFMFKDIDLYSFFVQAKKVLDLELVKKFLTYGLPMLGWLMGLQILNLSDRFILGFIQGSNQVGIYASNYGISISLASLLYSPLLMAAHPIIMNAWEDEKERDISRLIEKISRYFLLISFPALVYSIFLSKWISSLLLDNAYLPGNIVIPVTFAGMSLWNFSMYGHKGMELREKTNLLLVGVGIAVFTNLLLNILLIPDYGYFGAAIATLISYFIYPIYVYLITRDTEVPWNIPVKTIGNALLSSIGIIIPFFVCRQYGLLNSWITVIPATVVTSIGYLFALYVSGEIKDEIYYLWGRLINVI